MKIARFQPNQPDGKVVLEKQIDTKVAELLAAANAATDGYDRDA